MARETRKSRVMESLELGKDSAHRPLCLVQGSKIQPLPSGAYCQGRDISLGPGQRNTAETATPPPHHHQPMVPIASVPGLRGGETHLAGKSRRLPGGGGRQSGKAKETSYLLLPPHPRLFRTSLPLYLLLLSGTTLPLLCLGDLYLLRFHFSPPHSSRYIPWLHLLSPTQARSHALGLIVLTPPV